MMIIREHSSNNNGAHMHACLLRSCSIIPVKLDALNRTRVDDEADGKDDTDSIANKSVPNLSIPSLPDCIAVSGRTAWLFSKGRPSESTEISLSLTTGIIREEKRSPYGSFPDAPAVWMEMEIIKR